ncbi:MAG TPA: thiamine-phosphate kinase [Usitatibacteraceae bacterium]
MTAMTPEFSLIERFFTRPAATPGRALLGIGDDCALIRATAGEALAISTDTLVAGTHFFADADAGKLGHKALAVNLSDLAAMGATPRYVTLALTLPHIDEVWLAAFSRGFFALADVWQVELIGGDTTRGPLSMTLTVLGAVEAGRALRRDGAKAGDEVWVSGTLGGAALALLHLQAKIVLAPRPLAVAEERLHRPLPRTQLGQDLLGIATAAIDISDGLLADLGHICERSRLAASIERAAIPMSPALLGVRADLRDACVLAGGDDYELCFTAPAAQRTRIEALAGTLALSLTRIGVMQAPDGGKALVRVFDEKRHEVTPAAVGYDQFAAMS